MSLQDSIAIANRKAGLERQKLFARKSSVKTSDATLIDMLCDRAGELLAALGGEGDLRTAKAAMKTAVVIARRQRGRQ